MDKNFFVDMVDYSDSRVAANKAELTQSFKDQIADSAAMGLYHVSIQMDRLKTNPNILKEVCRELTSAGFRVKFPQYEDGLIVENSEMLIYWGTY